MGADPESVSERGVAQIEGRQPEPVAAAAKHFPGHGDTDSHTGLPIVTDDRDKITRERLEESVTRILQWKLDRGVWVPHRRSTSVRS